MTTPEPVLVAAADAVADPRFAEALKAPERDRVIAVARWATAIAVAEARGENERALGLLTLGPQDFMPDQEWVDNINVTTKIALAFIEGRMPAPEPVELSIPAHWGVAPPTIEEIK